MSALIQTNLPRHIAIIMDGNGRWAKQHGLPRFVGHRAGLESFKKIVKYCSRMGVQFLTMFAFSSENWQRPPKEVRHLMKLFVTALEREIIELNQINVRIRFVGELKKFDSRLQQAMKNAEELTYGNTGLSLNVAANYGGRWDILEATKVLAQQVANKNLSVEDITSELFSRTLSLGDIPEPDLFIRTSGEQRISNFLIWHLAYTELYFTSKLWPDFDENDLKAALFYYQQRDRRFGAVKETVLVEPEVRQNNNYDTA